MKFREMTEEETVYLRELVMSDLGWSEYNFADLQWTDQQYIKEQSQEIFEEKERKKILQELKEKAGF